MKLYSNLAATLRTVFAVLRVLTVILGFLIVLHLIFGKHFLAETFPLETLAETQLSVTSPNSGEVTQLRLRDLSGKFSVKGNTTDPVIVSAVRWGNLKYIALLALCYCLLSALKNVCGRISTGEIFSDANFRSVRTIGLLTIALQLIMAAFTLGNAYIIGDYVTQHAVLNGLNAQVAGTWPELAPFFLNLAGSCVDGAFILLFAEAVRQGLAIKRENELTV